jgi:hypothetical protein
VAVAPSLRAPSPPRPQPRPDDAVPFYEFASPTLVLRYTDEVAAPTLLTFDFLYGGSASWATLPRRPRRRRRGLAGSRARTTLCVGAALGRGGARGGTHMHRPRSRAHGAGRARTCSRREWRPSARRCRPAPVGAGVTRRGRRRGRGADPATGQAIRCFGDDSKASICYLDDSVDAAMAAATRACDLNGSAADPRQGTTSMRGTSPVGTVDWISDGLMLCGSLACCYNAI